jgi:hypothetical protein
MNSGLAGTETTTSVGPEVSMDPAYTSGASIVA